MTLCIRIFVFQHAYKNVSYTNEGYIVVKVLNMKVWNFINFEYLQLGHEESNSEIRNENFATPAVMISPSVETLPEVLATGLNGPAWVSNIKKTYGLT